MFASFFPRSKYFFWSVLAWTIVTMGIWYGGLRHMGGVIGLPPAAADAPPIIGLERFWSPSYLWFYLYYLLAVGLFAAFWNWAAPQRWWRWSILGSALILFVTYIQVEVSVTINDWFGPFYDMIQAALSKSAPVSLGEFYRQLVTFAEVAIMAVTVGTLTSFFASHYVFRWRTAMNDYYMEHWGQLRSIEGAAQRVQEDTMRFSTITESLGVKLIDAVMTLIAFLPVLVALSANVKELPLVGEVPHALVIAAILWSLFGTTFLMLIGIKLPGLQFANQRVEAAYRKELVYGEDSVDRAQPPTMGALFANVRKNYFRLYFHYMYFNVGRILYLQTDNIFPYIILAPTIIIGAITLGVMNQILRAFGEVRQAFQYLVTSWTTIVELLSIHKRLHAFEAVIDGRPMPPPPAIVDEVAA